jgi:aspartyl-tRNA(Asn)/glutamyl-tRNA(Gln) amidotransferase subunit A
VEPRALTIAAAAALIERGELSPPELVESVLAGIEEAEPRVNAFEEVFGDAAREQARAAEDEIRAGRHRGPLHGIPIGVKDLFAIEGAVSSGSSAALAENVATFDSTVVERLREAGAIPIGRTRTHEFAMGIVTPAVRNPHDPGRIAGGSSGGSAAAVVAHECLGAIGSDTGGSIRIPAALCGAVGLKPTYGLVSRFGMLPLAPSLDHAGPIGRTVEDVAILLEAIVGGDRRDPASVERPAGSFRERPAPGLAGVRIGVPTNAFWDPIEPEVESAVRAAIDALAEAGAEPREVELPLTELSGPVGSAISLVEAAACHRADLRERADLLEPNIRDLLELGTTVPAVDYLRALHARETVKRAWRELFEREGLTAVAYPTLPIVAPPAGTSAYEWPDGASESLDSAFGLPSIPADLTGMPALSLPCGADAAGLPIGLQLIGRPLEDATILGIGRAYEKLAAD